MHKSRVLDEDVVKAKDFFKRKRIPASLQDRAAPSLQPVARRTLTLDLETGLAVGQQRETGSACNEMGAGSTHDLPSPGRKVQRQKSRQSRGAPDNRTKPAAAQKIVSHAVAFRKVRLAGEIYLWFEKIDGGSGRRIIHIEAAPG